MLGLRVGHGGQIKRSWPGKGFDFVFVESSLKLRRLVVGHHLPRSRELVQCITRVGARFVIVCGLATFNDST